MRKIIQLQSIKLESFISMFPNNGKLVRANYYWLKSMIQFGFAHNNLDSLLCKNIQAAPTALSVDKRTYTTYYDIESVRLSEHIWLDSLR